VEILEKHKCKYCISQCTDKKIFIALKPACSVTTDVMLNNEIKCKGEYSVKWAHHCCCFCYCY